MTISEKAAYMKGLAEGLNLDDTTPIGKVMEKVLDLLSDLSAEVTDLREETNSLREYAEELDEDLGDVESDLWGDDDEEEDDEDNDEMNASEGLKKTTTMRTRPASMKLLARHAARPSASTIRSTRKKWFALRAVRSFRV